MTRTISLIIGITATVLSVGVAPALGEGRLAGSLEPAQATAIEKPQSTPIVSERVPMAQSFKAELARNTALNRKYGLGEFASNGYRDAHERVVEPQSLIAERLRSEGLNQLYGLGDFATSNGYVDAHERAVPPVSATPITVAPTVSDRDIEWPQLGIGFGVGLLLAFGLFLAMRMTRVRPLAH